MGSQIKKDKWPALRAHLDQAVLTSGPLATRDGRKIGIIKITAQLLRRTSRVGVIRDSVSGCDVKFGM